MTRDVYMHAVCMHICMHVCICRYTYGQIPVPQQDPGGPRASLTQSSLRKFRGFRLSAGRRCPWRPKSGSRVSLCVYVCVYVCMYV